MAKKDGFRVGDVNVYGRGRYWHCSFWTPAGRQRKALHTTSRRTAERKAREYDELVSRQAWQELELVDQPRGKAVSFRDFIYQEYLPKYCDWAETTLKGNKGRLRLICVEWGDRPLDSITARDIKTYLKRRQEEGLSRASQNRYLAMLKALFKAAVAYGHCRTNPTTEVTMQREAQKVPDALTESQVEALLPQCSDRIRPCVTVAVDTGLRRSELFGLRWGDVDLVEEGQLIVRKSKSGEFRGGPRNSDS